MKLIVDIPDMAYEAYKEWHKQGVSNVEQSLIALAMPYEERPHGNWFDCIEAGTLKARHGDYVLYKVDFLLDHLAREVYVMEGVRRMKGRRI